jgi:transcriptional regulator of acetoin/glycerol metabolism
MTNMARADLILQLVKAGAKGDQAQFQKIVEALAADERDKSHGILADRLLAQLKQDGNGYPRQISSLLARPLSSPLVAELVPVRRIEDLILHPDTEQVVRELVEEQHRADLLRSYNLEPRNRVLLAGPPGNGKTTLAEAIAEALSAPFLVVRYEAIIGSYLGETAQRIGQVFEYARSRSVATSTRRERLNG